MQTVSTFNSTNHRIWITIYDLGKTRHLDYGWLEPITSGQTIDGVQFSSRPWRSGNYMEGSYYHVRGEVKDANGNTIFDTNIEIGVSTIPADDTVSMQTDGNGNYWWIHGLPPEILYPGDGITGLKQ